jgi:hypothetical protein
MDTETNIMHEVVYDWLIVALGDSYRSHDHVDDELEWMCAYQADIA